MPVGEFLIEGDERRSGIVRRPPLALRDDGAFGRRRGIGDAAVAVHRPFRVRRDRRVLRRHALDRDDPSTDHRRALVVLRRCEAVDDLCRSAPLRPAGCRRRRSWAPCRAGDPSPARDRVIEQRDGGEQGQAQAQRGDHARRRRARAASDWRAPDAQPACAGAAVAAARSASLPRSGAARRGRRGAAQKFGREQRRGRQHQSETDDQPSRQPPRRADRAARRARPPARRDRETDWPARSTRARASGGTEQAMAESRPNVAASSRGSGIEREMRRRGNVAAIDVLDREGQQCADRPARRSTASDCDRHHLQKVDEKNQRRRPRRAI